MVLLEVFGTWFRTAPAVPEFNQPSSIHAEVVVTTTVGLANNPLSSDQPMGLGTCTVGSYPMEKFSNQTGEMAVRTVIGPFHMEGGKLWETHVPRTYMWYWV